METPEGAGSLGSKEFKLCVRQVIDDYGPRDLGEATIRTVVDDIVTLAKDRLCLLAGKGESQENIDFVIQPFREYFAAAYLAHHEDADPDRVYNSLVRRSNVWGNVLQFYVAFQAKAIQSSWIVEADGTGVDQSKSEGLLEMTRKRRTLIRVLPEFERPKNEYMQRAFENLFRKSTRWAWHHRRETVSLLHAFAKNESFAMLKELFNPLSTDDPGMLFVELDLLAKTMSPLNQQFVRDTLEQLFENELLRSVALKVAISNDVYVKPKRYPTSCFSDVRMIEVDYFRGGVSNFAKGLSEDQLVDIMCFSPNLVTVTIRNPAEKTWINEFGSFLRAKQAIVDLDFLQVSMPPFLADRSGLDTTPGRTHPSF